MVTVTQLQPSEVAHVDRCLPLNRLDQQRADGSTYLVAWDDDQPHRARHVVAWDGTHLSIPEIQDVFVLPERRRRGIAAQLTGAAEQEARLGRLGQHQPQREPTRQRRAARTLYAKLSYADAGVDPVRVSGTIVLRGRPFEVDDTLLYLGEGSLGPGRLPAPKCSGMTPERRASSEHQLVSGSPDSSHSRRDPDHQCARPVRSAPPGPLSRHQVGQIGGCSSSTPKVWSGGGSGDEFFAGLPVSTAKLWPAFRNDAIRLRRAVHAQQHQGGSGGHRP